VNGEQGFRRTLPSPIGRNSSRWTEGNLEKFSRFGAVAKKQSKEF
jgi:hypothetical protein